MTLKELIGDYEAFFSDLLHRLKKKGIDVTGMPMTHLLYRVETLPEYESLLDQLKAHCKEFADTQFNGRAVAILILEKPLILEEGFTVSMIELPAPRPVHMYPTGLESIGLYAGKLLSQFKEQYKDVLTGVKEHGQYCQPAFVTFENDKTVKFYDYTLKDIVLRQGYIFEKLK